MPRRTRDGYLGRVHVPTEPRWENGMENFSVTLPRQGRNGGLTSDDLLDSARLHSPRGSRTSPLRFLPRASRSRRTFRRIRAREKRVNL
jgi:hypothetical protein